MKRILIALLCGLLFCPISIAQKKGKQKEFDHEGFRKKIEMFIIEKAGLSPEDAGKFFPIYHEMKEKQMKIGHKIMKLKRNPLDDDDENEEEEWEEAVTEIEELKVEQAQIGEIYVKRLCKTISAEKVFKALKAEDAFHRHMLKDFRRGGEQKDIKR